MPKAQADLDEHRTVTEVWFYHLEDTRLEQALPALLGKSLARGWRAVVQATGTERVEALDHALWIYDDASFLAHGTARDGDGALQPVYLTDGLENPNGASIRFLVDGADAGAVLAAGGGAYERLILMFDGNNAEEVLAARRQWTTLKNAGHAVTYWKQSEDGRWEKRG